MSKRGLAIITGAAQGIGEAIARRLASNGYRVCINDVGANQARVDSVVSSLNLSHGPNTAIGIAADSTNASAVENMITQAVESLDTPLTLMVANAGICQVKPALDLTEADVRRMFDVNVIGLFNCYTLAAKQMIKQGPLPQLLPRNKNEKSLASHGWTYKIIGAASTVAYRPYPLCSHYSASKWAVRGFTQGFAMEMAQHKIAVNAYAPGVIGTAMWDRIDEDVSHVHGRPKGESTRLGTDGALMGRIGTPDDVASVVAGFLAGADGAFVNGQTIIVDGGSVFT